MLRLLELPPIHQERKLLKCVKGKEVKAEEKKAPLAVKVVVAVMRLKCFFVKS